VGCAKGVVDKVVDPGGEGLGVEGVVLLLLLVEADVLEQEDLKPGGSEGLGLVTIH
jgi:hypothetical protein